MDQYTKLIKENVAPSDVRRIGIYNEQGFRVGYIPLEGLTPPVRGKRSYTFGAISDVHIGQETSEEDFKAALKYLSKNAEFICVCGDLVHGGGDKVGEQIPKYIQCVNEGASVPVYAIAGNHDGSHVSNIESVISTYTGKPLYYSFTHGDDVFIMVGNRSTQAGSLFTTAELQWLYETLEANRNKRCFLFEHVRPNEGCGNALGLYKPYDWGGTEAQVFESLLRHYKNVIFFHGHSHLKFIMQEFEDDANIDNHFNCLSVHIPSISVPRANYDNTDMSITTYYAESEGYVVDVYDNGIHLQGRNFITGEFIPVASYWLDTPLQNIEAKTYKDSTGTIKT